MTAKKSMLASNIVWLYGLQGLNYLIPAAMLPYLVRVLGVEQYGLIAFAQAIAQYFVIATDYGFNFSATRAIAQGRDDKNEVSRVFWTVTTIKLFLLVLGALVLGAAVFAIPRFHANWNIYFAAYVAVIGNAIFPTWLFQGMERMRSISIITGLAKLASALLVIIFVHSRQDTFLATLLLSSGFLLAGVVGMVVALRSHVKKFVLPSQKDIFAALRDGRHLFLTTAAISLYSNTNTFLVGMIAGNAQAGYFSLADKLIRAITGLVAPVIQAAYPHMIRSIAESRDLALAFVRKTLIWGAGLGFLLGLSVLLLAKPLALLAFSHNAVAAIPLLRCLSLFPPLASASYILGVLVLIPFGFDKAQSRLLFAVGLVNIAIGFILIPHLGALGGVIAMSIIEALQILGSTLILARGGVNLLHAPMIAVPAPD
ncbi:MAG: oligosaccharide flippase family protein [Acidobacteriaceae bacterium]